MVTQSRSHSVPLLLTRPEVQGADFANDLVLRFGDSLQIIKTPLMAPRFFDPALPVGPFSALILTSQTGVEAVVRLGWVQTDLPKDVFCVGQQTANFARSVGLNPLIIAPDAAALIAQIKDRALQGKLLHLRGQDARGDVAKHLNSAGIDTVPVVTYVQMTQALTLDAQLALAGKLPVLVPLFSPRTAKIFVQEVARIGGNSPLFIAAISGAVALEAAALKPQIRIAATPDAPAMMNAVALLLEDIKRA